MTKALAEMRRVLKRHGSFHFAEHGHAPDQRVARWQQRIEPFWLPLGGGCHLTRNISDRITVGGSPRSVAQGLAEPPCRSGPAAGSGSSRT